jgi:protein-tyrosine phosphatase
MRERRILFVCLGNICRSPTAEGVLRKLVEARGLSASFRIDSAGTSSHHEGELPDPRTRAAARRRGVALEHRARGVTEADFRSFDLLLAMDAANVASLRRMRPSDATAEVRLLRSFDPESPPDAEVPDPYYGGSDGFEDVLDLVERACVGLLDEMTKGSSR